MSCARISGLLYGLMGLLFGACVSVISLLGGIAAGSSNQGYQMLFGTAAVIVLPILYGGVGFVGSLIAAALYNWLAKMVGGVELDLQ
jgi:hypothetical protein